MKHFLLALAAFAVLSTAMAHDPSLTVFGQSAIDGNLTIDTVHAAEDGFVVVHAFDGSGNPVLTPPLGLTFVEAGTHRYLKIPLDPELLSEYGYGEVKNLLPMLHVDANDNGTYEFPEGPDVPVMVNGEMLVAPLELSPASASTPGYGMGIQLPLDLGANGMSVTVPSVTLAQPGFVVLHSTDAQGQMVVVPALAHSEALPAGTHENVTIWFTGPEAPVLGDKVIAMLHSDDGDGMYAFPESDPPTIASGEMVLLPITLR